MQNKETLCESLKTVINPNEMGVTELINYKEKEP